MGGIKEAERIVDRWLRELRERNLRVLYFAELFMADFTLLQIAEELNDEELARRAKRLLVEHFSRLNPPKESIEHLKRLLGVEE